MVIEKTMEDKQSTAKVEINRDFTVFSFGLLDCAVRDAVDIAFRHCGPDTGGFHEMFRVV